MIILCNDSMRALFKKVFINYQFYFTYSTLWHEIKTENNIQVYKFNKIEKNTMHEAPELMHAP